MEGGRRGVIEVSLLAGIHSGERLLKALGWTESRSPSRGFHNNEATKPSARADKELEDTNSEEETGLSEDNNE